MAGVAEGHLAAEVTRVGGLGMIAAGHLQNMADLEARLPITAVISGILSIPVTVTLFDCNHDYCYSVTRSSNVTVILYIQRVRRTGVGIKVQPELKNIRWLRCRCAAATANATLLPSCRLR
jgi:hypothetical protein